MAKYWLRTWLLSLVILLFLALWTCGAFSLSDHLIWPEASGTVVLEKNKLTVDASHSEDGYIMVKAVPGDKRYKVRVSMKKQTLTYDLNNEGEFEVFPLQMGSGQYTISLFINASGKKYADAGSVKSEFILSDENAPFRVPNQFVNYTIDSKALKISDEVCRGLTAPKDKYEAVRQYMMTSFTYDYEKAVTVAPGTLPDMDYVLENKKGICQDLSALAACMLRVQDVPTKLMIGYCGKQYHAWNYVTIDGQDVLYDATADIGGVQPSKYSIERYY